jgi:hypothetical protein
MRYAAALVLTGLVGAAASLYTPGANAGVYVGVGVPAPVIVAPRVTVAAPGYPYIAGPYLSVGYRAPAWGYSRWGYGPGYRYYGHPGYLHGGWGYGSRGHDGWAHGGGGYHHR